MKCISIFKCNPQIEVIDKSHCSLEDVPNFQNYSRSLEELFLDANKLTVLNDNVFRLTKLRRFSFSDNAIQFISPDIAKLINLVELDCSRNDIQNIPEQIKYLRGLQVCDFSANQIEYLPPGLVQLKNLTCLTLNYCAIRKLPDDFGLLKNLESLELHANDLESLPPSLSGLESLKKLDVGRNRLTELPEDIGSLTKLQYLLADGNMLETLPAKISRLENLQCLDLSQQEGGLRYLPEEIGGLVSLTDLHLSENHLEILPDGVRNLRKLTIFKVDKNYLSELNTNIGGCTSLQELVLTSNELTRLPSSIGNLTDLRSLNVDSNFLKELTPQVGNLKRLGILSLRDNLLSHLPTEIGQLELIRVMDISGNRLEYLPISITALNLKALWLSKNQAQPLPKLQIDELPNSGTRVLTCYLLPQQSEVSEQFDDNNASFAVENDAAINRPPAVSFDTAVIEDAELADDTQFVRHDTPHPREFKARHQKLFSGKLKGHDNASFTMADNYSDDSQDPNSKYNSNDNGGAENNITTSYNINNHNINSNSISNSFNNNNNNLSNNIPPARAPKPNINLKCIILDILVLKLERLKAGLGLSIAGGKDTPPYKDDDEGIFVSKITPGGPAEVAGVKVGDKVLAVNDNIFYEGITHQKAVEVFKKVKPDSVGFTMRVLRDPNYEIVETNDDIVETNGVVPYRTYSVPIAPEVKEQSNIQSIVPSIIYTTLVKDYQHDLGLVLEDRTDEGESNIVIADILPDSLASRDGKLQVDDRLLCINGADVGGIDLDRIMMMLEGTDRFLRIVVSRGDDSALRKMPIRPALGSWFSSTNMSHRPSLIESYQRPIFGSVNSLQKPATQGAKPPKPPKPTHLLPKDSLHEEQPREKGVSGDNEKIEQIFQRAEWRRERFKSIDDDVEMAKAIAEAQRKLREK